MAKIFLSYAREDEAAAKQLDASNMAYIMINIYGIQKKYDEQTTAYYAAARLWVDAIINPGDTRMLISEGIKAADQNPVIEDFKTGILQV